MEKGSLLGLICLAVSDLCFCVGVLPQVFRGRHPATMFTYPGFWLYHQMYAIYFQNVFIKISTCLTMVIATSRYLAICHPLKARMFVGLNKTKLSMLLIYLLWMLFMAPMLWSHKLLVSRFPPNSSNATTIYIVDNGPFEAEPTLRKTFTYLWSVSGYMLPVAILGYCNMCLIRALRASRELRETAGNIRKCKTMRNADTRITLTLISLVIMYIILVSPSEIIHFYMDIATDTVRHNYQSFKLASVCTNVLQTINSSFHFILYVIVNASFRRTVMSFFYLCFTGSRPARSDSVTLNGRRSRGSGRRSTMPTMLQSSQHPDRETML